MSDLRLSFRSATTVLQAGVLTGSLFLGVLGAGAAPALAAATPMVDLGQASTYAVLSGASVGNTVSAPTGPHTTLRGDLGVKVATEPTGFPPGVVTGTSRIGTAAAAAAHADVVTAYTEVKDRTGGVALAGALAGATIAPGLHTIAGAASNTTTVTLDGGGNPNAVFVFQINGAMAFAAGSHVVLTNGARASRVFWQVNGAGAVGANADFAGTLMAMDAVAMGAGTMVNGRAFARNGALTLDANEFYSSPPAVTIAGGSAAITTDTTPTIGGTTDVEAPGIITVTVGGQTLTTTPSDGAWSVTSALLANATYPVIASVTDAVGNSGGATQQLTVDTVLPVVTIDDGPSALTNDPTPTISGTSDAAVGTEIRVTVDAQTRKALVHSDATWNVTPSALTDGTRTVSAAVTDPAGNVGSDSQQLTVDTAAPAVTILGGATALTNDATPEISGTADDAAGQTVTVDLADETLSGQVQPDGTWSLLAAALIDGPHRVVMTVSDAAGNRARFTQWLTIDTVSPVVAISGGETASTSDTSPTIRGTDAVPGTTITVTIGGQTLTTLVQSDGTWNATPTSLGAGAWPVVVSTPDPAGNVGSATQTLTIAAAAPDPGGTGGTTSPAPLGGPLVIPTPTPTSTPVPADGGPTSTVATTTVAPSTSQRVTGSVLSIATKVTAPAKGAVVVTAGGTVKIKGAKKAIKLITKTVTVHAGQTLTLKLTPKGTKKAVKAALKTIKTAIKRGKKVTATITLKIVDAAGHTRNATRTVKLTK
jgi:hypothetical protein